MSSQQHLPQNTLTETVEFALQTLEPVKDLAQNWDIDIQGCLEDYLRDLMTVEHEVPSAGDHHHNEQQQGTTLNFAQAALVVQKSSHVYSGKVEYLYNLVYKMASLLASMKHNGNSKATNEKQVKTAQGKLQAELDRFWEFDVDLQFLELNDVLPTDFSDDCRAINLPEPGYDHQHGDRRRSSARFSLSMVRASSYSNDSTTSSMMMAGANLQRIVDNVTHSQSSSSLRLQDGFCDLDDNGALYVPGVTSRRSSWATDAAAQDDQMLPAAQHQHYNDDDADDDGGAFAFGGENDDDDHAPAAARDGEREAASTAAPSSSSRSYKKVTFAPNVRVDDDPWRMLDPYKTPLTKTKPLKIGNTLRLPPHIKALPSAAGGGSSARVKVPPLLPPAVPPPLPAALPTSYGVQMFAACRKRRALDDSLESSNEVNNDAVSLPRRGLAFGQEFAYLAQQNAVYRAAQRRQQRQNLAQREQTMDVDNNVDDQYGDAGPTDDDDDDVGAFAFAGDDDDDNIDENAVADGMPNNTGLASLDDVYGQRDFDQEGASHNNDHCSFEDLCRAHLAKFARGVEQHVRHSRLSQRVNAWQEKLAPLLEREEQRPPFDIHAYGRDVITVMERVMGENDTDDKSGRIVGFDQITAGRDGHEVCRTFLATLSLLNSGNLDISVFDLEQNTLQFALVKAEMDRPMETYLTPSAAEAIAIAE